MQVCRTRPFFSCVSPTHTGELMMKDLRVARTFALSFTSFVFTSLAVIALISVLASCAGRSVSGASTPGLGTPKTGKKTMRAFASEDELKSYFRKLAEERKREAGRSSSNQSANAPAPAATTANGLAKADDSKDKESITNTQHAGVDEGGIVKL